MTNSQPVKVLIDSDALIALVGSNDPNHDKAVKIYKKFTGAQIYLTNTTFGEVITALGRKVSREVSLVCLDYIASQAFGKIYLNELQTVEAEVFYRNQTSKKNTFFDCLNMAVAKTFGVDFIFSFDQGYEKNGFKLLK